MSLKERKSTFRGAETTPKNHFSEMENKNDGGLRR